ncbi:hypothetical protein KUTeg_003054 [Tegillarca granosa]|uniref:Uncharacterized protein n=1 Tax=Tegillarca granosa TaxID=220873 RepID=A0ABQ9FL09_TEGGR|nr:hypothetical protein KUTeg_003054 [Tegillarca granosa]
MGLKVMLRNQKEAEKPERKHFKRVEIKEPVKNLMNKNRSPDRKSPDRDRSKSPAERRSRSQSPRDTRDLLHEIEDEETSPKSILRKSDKYHSPRSSLDRSRYDTESYHSRPDHERSPRYSPRSPRSPHYSPSPDRYRSGERSPRYSPSPDRYRSGTDSSPRYSPSRDRSPTFERTLEQSILSTKIDIEQENRMSGETSPGRTPSEADPNRRLARVLGKELELLKLKVEVLEKSNMQDDSGLVGDNVTQRISGRLKEQMKRSPSSSPRRHKSPDYDRGRMFRKKEEISTPQYRSKSDSRYSRKTPSPDRQTRSVTPTLRAQSFEELPRDTTVSDSLDGKLKFSPSRQRSRQIDLGYSSPVRKVSEEIWGIGHSDDDEITSEKVMSWKKLIAKDAIEDNDVLELKQALANCITENDIVRAQLNNANVDIKEKMSKTNDVLNDVRSHLARSQAENMELRTQLEKERTRNDSLEERIREHEKALVNAKSANADLEAELERTVSLLKGTSKKEIPTLQNLTEERDELKDLLANTHKDNTALREELDQAKKQNTKAQTTINDLRGILEEAKKERKQLFDEISQLHKEGHLNKISNIINNYVEQELYQEGKTNGYVIQNRSGLVPSPRVPSPRSRFDQSYIESVMPSSPRSRSSSAGKSKNESPMNRSSIKNNSFSKSSAESQRHLRQESPSYSSYYVTSSRSTPVNQDNTDYYDYEDVSPTVPSSYREIYPHRRSRSYVSNFSSPYDKDDYMDDLEVQKLMCKQPFRKLDFDNELDGSYSPRLSRKDYLRYPTPPRQTKSPTLTNKHWYGEDNDPYFNSNYDEDRDSVESVVESPIDNRFRDESLEDRRKMIDLDNSINDKKFLQALDGAVQGQTKKCLDDIDTLEQKLIDQKQRDHVAPRVGSGRSYLSRSMSPGLLKGILKKTKSEQNMNIKERNFPSYRSYYSHSASPSRTVTLGDKSPSFTQSKLTDNSFQSRQTSKVLKDQQVYQESLPTNQAVLKVQMFYLGMIVTHRNIELPPLSPIFAFKLNDYAQKLAFVFTKDGIFLMAQTVLDKISSKKLRKNIILQTHKS